MNTFFYENVPLSLCISGFKTFSICKDSNQDSVNTFKLVLVYNYYRFVYKRTQRILDPDQVIAKGYKDLDRCQHGNFARRVHFLGYNLIINIDTGSLKFSHLKANRWKEPN